MKKDVKDLGFVWEGYVTTRNLSEELDTAVVMLSTKDESELAIWDIVTLDGADYLVASLETERTLDPDLKYKHTLLLVEPTKYLERITLPNFALTRRESLRAQLERLLINAEPVHKKSDCRFKLAPDLEAKLNGVPGEEFFFSAPTLREAIDSLLSVVGLRAKIKSIDNYAEIAISYLNLANPEDSMALFGNRAAEKAAHSITDHAAEVESSISNALASGVVAYFPSKEGFAQATSAEFTESSDNMMFKLTYPLERLIKFEIMTRIELTFLTSDDREVFKGAISIPFDMSYFFLEEELYNLLDEHNKWEAFPGHLTKGNTLPYNVGSDELYIGGSVKTGVVTKEILEQMRSFMTKTMAPAINKVLTTGKVKDDNALYETFLEVKKAFLKEHAEGLKNKKYDKIQLSSLTALNYGTMSPDSIYARITYEPQLNLHLRTAKPGDLVPNTLFSNPIEKYADVWRSFDALRAQAEGLGNKDLVLVMHDDEEIPLGTSYRGYTLTGIESAHFNHHTKHSYIFSEHYRYVPDRLAVDRRRRLYNIPLDFIERDILIKDYLSLGQKLPATFGRFDIGDLALYGAPTVLHFTTHCEGGSWYGWYELPLTEVRGANNLLLSTRTSDNYSVATCLKGRPRSFPAQRARKLALNPYVDDNGEFESLHITLTNEKVRDYYGHPSIPKIEKTGFPYIDNPNEPLYYNPPSFKAYTLLQSKDKTERITFSAQLEAFTSDETVFIGNAFLDFMKIDELLILSQLRPIKDANAEINPKDGAPIVLEKHTDKKGSYFSFKSPARFVGIYNRRGELIAGINEGEGETYYLASLAKTRTRLLSEEELAALKEKMMHLTKIEMTIAGEHEKTLSFDNTPQLGTTINLVSSSDVLNPNVTPKETLAQKLGTTAKPISAYLKVHDGYYELTFIEMETATGNGLAVGLSATKGFTIKLLQGETEVIGAKIKHTKPPI